MSLVARAVPPTVESLMGRMASGDVLALFEMREHYRGPIARVVVSWARRMNLHHFGGDTLDELVTDACVELFHVAGAWQPDGGARPWHWASSRIRAVVSRYVGQYAVEFEDDWNDTTPEAPRTASVVDEPPMTTLLRLACRDGRCAAFLDHLRLRIPNERDQALYLEMVVQRTAGDPSPANTVADLFDMKPAAVRQAFRRARLRIEGAA